MSAKKKAPAKKADGPFVLVAGVKVPVPAEWPIAGEWFKTVLWDEIPPDPDELVVYARLDFCAFEFHLLKTYPTMESFLSARDHEFNEGVNNLCDLDLTHAQLSVLAQFRPRFELAFTMAQ